MQRSAGVLLICMGLACGDTGGPTTSADTTTGGDASTNAAASTTAASTDTASTAAASTDAASTASPTSSSSSSPTGSPTSGEPTTTTAATPATTGDITSEPGTDTGAPDTSTGEPADGLAELLPADLFAEMFPQHDPLYSHAALLAAAAEYPAFASEGSPDQRRRELAAFLANIGHETTGGWADAPGGPYAWGLYFTQEVGCEGGGCVGYCDANNVEHPCAPGKTYHGRGPIQLSWNYNYGQAGAALGEPLLAQPELVATDGAIAFRTGLWFWMTAQAPKPSAHAVMTGLWQPTPDDVAKGRQPGFGMTINIINGGLECGKPTGDKVKSRVGFYERFTAMLAVDQGPAIYCDTMQPY